MKKVRGRNKRVTIVFQRQDEWLYNFVEKLVAEKKAAGFPSSISFELTRLARAGLGQSIGGEEVDRAIAHKEEIPSKCS